MAQPLDLQLAPEPLNSGSRGSPTSKLIFRGSRRGRAANGAFWMCMGHHSLQVRRRPRWDRSSHWPNRRIPKGSPGSGGPIGPQTNDEAAAHQVETGLTLAHGAGGDVSEPSSEFELEILPPQEPAPSQASGGVGGEVAPEPIPLEVGHAIAPRTWIASTRFDGASRVGEQLPSGSTDHRGGTAARQSASGLVGQCRVHRVTDTSTGGEGTVALPPTARRRHTICEDHGR